MGFRLGLRQRSRAERPHLLVSRYRSQSDYERDARRMLADGWKMSGWQRLDPDAAPDVIIATWVRDEEE
jgi:hypothetical protein